jgi:hypothetical protein
VVLRQQAAAGKKMNCSAASLRAQSDGDIHAGQAGTEQQNTLVFPPTLVWGSSAQRASRPGIRDVMLTVRRFSRQAEIPRWKIAEGEHNFVSEEHFAAEQPDFRRSTKASD